MSAARATIPTPVRAATFDTLIGLVATAGMRIVEATRFQRGVLDTVEDVITVDAPLQVRQVPPGACVRPPP